MIFVDKCCVCKESLFDAFKINTSSCFNKCTHLYVDEGDNIFLQLRKNDIVVISRFLPYRYEYHVYDPTPTLPYYNSEKSLMIIYSSDVPEDINDTYNLCEYLLSLMNKLVKYKSFT